MGQASALTDEAFHGGEEARGLSAVSRCAQHIIDALVFLVAPLVKEHGGLHQHALLRHVDAVRQTGDMAVFPQIVGAAFVDGHGGAGRQGLRCVQAYFSDDYIIPNPAGI